jgi:protein disulfide-isomerase
MRPILATLAALVATASFACAAEGWTRDFEAAKAQSKAENKPIFLYFTGSDWCGWCKKMEKDILKTKEFLTFAKENIILVELDYPKNPANKAKQPEAEVAQNKALDDKFKITGYPTIYLVDAQGERLPGSEDFALDKFTKDGAAGFIQGLKDFLAKKPVE